MYVDEVGNADLRSSDDPNHRFLSLTGVVIGLGHVESVVHPQMEALKSAYFGSHPDDPVILHRKELVNRRGPFVSLRDPAVNAAFDRELLGLMRSGTTRSSRSASTSRRIGRSTPSGSTTHITTASPCCWSATSTSSIGVAMRGDVIAESRGGKEDRRLKDSFARLCEKGSGYADAGQMSGALTSRQLKVKQKSNNLAGLQLADLVAHPSRNEILNENGHAMTIAPVRRQGDRRSAGQVRPAGGRVFGKKML